MLLHCISVAAVAYLLALASHRAERSGRYDTDPMQTTDWPHNAERDPNRYAFTDQD